MTRSTVNRPTAVCDEQVPQELAEPAAMLGDGLAHRVVGVGYSAAALTKGQPDARLAPELIHGVEGGQRHVPRRRPGDPRGRCPLLWALLVRVGADELVLGREVVVEGRLGDPGLGDDPVDADPCTPSA